MKKNNIDLKPNSFDEMICKDVIFPQDSVIIKMIENKDLFSILFFGNPGVGKSLAIEFILKKLKKDYYYFNSTKHNKQDLDNFLQTAHDSKTPPVIVIEEIHRLNKDKQDLLLMYLEKKMIVVFATTTENPFFKVNPAIRSRMFLYKIENVEPKTLTIEFKKYLEQKQINIPNKILETVIEYCKSDFRSILFYLEIVLKYYPDYDEKVVLEQLFKIHASNVDRQATNHYDLLSAFHKSIRGSNPDAAVYYLALLLESGDLSAIYRRLYAVAYEDIGLANPIIGVKVNAAINASEALGMPEAKIPLSNITIELALSPKSNSTYSAISKAFEAIQKGNYDVPHHLRDNHYKSAVKLGVKGYLFPHDYKNHYVEQEYLNKELKNIKFYDFDKYSEYEQKLKTYWDKIKNNKSEK